MLEKGAIKVYRISLHKFSKGFDGVVKGMDAMCKGKISGEKVVYMVE